MVAGVVEANAGGRFDLTCFRGHRGHPEFDAMVSPDRSRWGRRAGGYGQTEVMGMATFTLLARDGIGLHGRPSPLVALRVVDPDGQDVPVGETGEMVLSGSTVMNGYWNRPEENVRRRLDGWHRTGDLGRYETDGTVTFVGPLGRMLKSGAENIYPAEVEGCLRAHPAVADAAVIGVPDPTWVQSVLAVVVLVGDDGADTIGTDDLILHCRERLASYKKPKAVELVDALPRLDTGAVDYATLDERFGGGGYPGGTTRSV
jgi:long-chain acyl-CoA synthetase